MDRPLLTVGSHDPVGRALELMREHGVSQVPVVSGEDGRAFMGTVSERGLLMASADHPGILGEPVTEVIEPPLPELAAESPVSEAIHMLLGERKPVIVVEDGRALGILASVDLIEAPEPVSAARMDTRVVHAGLEPDPTYGSVIPPIHQTSTFVQPAPGEFVERLRLRALGEPDPDGARARPGRARGRPGERVLERDGRDPRAADRGARRPATT